MTRDLKVSCDPWRTWINWHSRFYYSVLCDFEMQVLQMVRLVYQEWLRYVICNMEPWLCHLRLCFILALFLVLEQVIKKSILPAYFHNSGKQNFHIHDPLFFSFVNHVRDIPPCTTLTRGHQNVMLHYSFSLIF